MVLEVSLRFLSSPLLWTTFLQKAGDGTGDYLPQIKGRMLGSIFQIWSDIIHLDENFMDGKIERAGVTSATPSCKKRGENKQGSKQTSKSSIRL